MVRVETLVTLVTVVTVSLTLSPMTELVRTRIMLVRKTEAEVSVPSVSSPAWTFSMMVMTEEMLAMVLCKAVTAASYKKTVLLCSTELREKPSQRWRMVE